MDPKSIVNGCGSVSSQLRGMELALEITGRPGIFGNAAVIGREPESANVLRPTGIHRGSTLVQWRCLDQKP